MTVFRRFAVSFAVSSQHGSDRQRAGIAIGMHYSIKLQYAVRDSKGTGEGIRTPEPSRAADFKSAAYAISPPRQGTSATRPESYHTPSSRQSLEQRPGSVV